jgi:PhnB protein
MAVQIYVYFDGKCEEAVKFYADAFESPAPEFMRFKDRPDPNYPLVGNAGERIMHTELKIEGDTVMFSDSFPGMDLTVGDNISLTVVAKDIAKTRRYFDLLKVGGEIAMELQETFWTPLYGSLTDRYGIVWQFSTDSK